MKETIILASGLILFAIVISKTIMYVFWSGNNEDCNALGVVLEKEVKLIGRYCTYIDDKGVLNRVFM